MTSRDFCYWLQGYIELAKDQQLTPGQFRMIQSHLSMVFKHEIDPSMGNETHQEELNQLHNPLLWHGGDPLARC